MDTIWNFLNSNLFVALLGTTGAIVAYIVYRRKISGEKKDAANILLLEIQNAKRQIAAADKKYIEAEDDELKMLAEDIFLMPNESWNRYKYLFVQDFDRDEWDTLTSFYERCSLFDKAVLHNNNAFHQGAEQIRAAMASVVAEVVKNFIRMHPTSKRNSKLERETVELGAKAADMILDNPSVLYYAPRKPVLDARKQLETVKMANLVTVTSKLKKIAKLK